MMDKEFCIRNIKTLWSSLLKDIKVQEACAILEKHLGIGHSHTESPCPAWNWFIRGRRYTFP